MNEQERIEQLEKVLVQFLNPVKGIPFYVVVRALSKHEVIPIDRKSPADLELIEGLKRCAALVGQELRKKPILRPRPNEVGNDIEGYIKQALPRAGLKWSRPLSALGHAQGVGYPDILIEDAEGRPTYLEAKIYSKTTADSSQRSFYLSPSENMKVSKDARHLLLAFEMERELIPGQQLFSFTAAAFKLVDLHELEIDVKYEFQSDNQRLYEKGAVLATGKV